jgi:hypothetical protein
MSSSLGIVLNHEWPSTIQWFYGIGFTWRNAASPLGPLTCGWTLCGRLAFEAAESGLLSPELAAGNPIDQHKIDKPGKPEKNV